MSYAAIIAGGTSKLVFDVEQPLELGDAFAPAVGAGFNVARTGATAVSVMKMSYPGT
jgi:hypothetical protein